MDGFVRRQDGAAPGCGGGIGAPAQGFPVIDGGFDSRDAFMVERAPLPAIGDFVSVGADFVGTNFLEVLAFAVKYAHVRAEELVGGADEEIAIQGADVDWTMRSVVDGVNVGDRSSRARQADNFGDVVDGADSVGGVSDRD